MKTGRLLLAALAMSCVAEAVRAQGPDDSDETEAYTIYSEIDVVEGAYFASTELYAALNGDWSRPGFLLHAYFGAGQYDYRNNDVPGGRVDAVPISADLMIGYYGSVGQAAYWNVLVGHIPQQDLAVWWGWRKVRHFVLLILIKSLAPYRDYSICRGRPMQESRLRSCSSWSSLLKFV